jgi:hypothetical protein
MRLQVAIDLLSTCAARTLLHKSQSASPNRGLENA